MVIDYKIILGILAVLLNIIGYYFYFKDIFAFKTKPHIYSWIIWTILTTIGFFIQVQDGAGAGAWITGTTALAGLAILLLSIKYGEKNITKSDKISLFFGFVALILWLVVKLPLYSVILITIIDMFGYYPTFRKSFYKPHEETFIMYFLAGVKFLIGLFAISNYTVLTTLYPLSLVIANFTFVIYIFIRKRQLGLK